MGTNMQIMLSNMTALVIRGVIVALIVTFILAVVRMFIRKRWNLGSLKIKNKKQDIPIGSLNYSKLDIDNNPNGFIFGKWKKKKAFLNCEGEGHIFVFGGSGSGKTSALLIPSLRTWLGSFFVIDISGDIVTNVDCEDKVIINPDDPDNSVVYDILSFVDDAKDEQTKRERIESLVNLIIDKPTGTTSDATKYYLDTARTIFLASVTAFYGQKLDFVEICKIVFFNGYQELFNKIKETNNELAVAYVQSLEGGNEKNISGAKDELNKKIKMFADNENVAKVVHHPDPIERNGKTVPQEYFVPKFIERKRVFLVIPDTKTEYYSTFMRVVVGQILDYMAARDFKRGKDKRILLALDEFASIGHINSREPLEKDRKRGVNICILTQSLAHLDLLYSHAERKIILDNCQYTAILGANENETRKYFSELVGKRESIRTSTTTSDRGRSVSSSTQKEYIIDPENWNKLGDWLILVHPGGYCKLEKNYYFR